MEDLLMAWIQMEIVIKGNRLLNTLSFNEMIVCNVINSNDNVTAALLCEKTQLLKSQMNRLLTSLEAEGLIERKVSPSDKRKIVITMTEKGQKVYSKEHEHVLNIVSCIERKMGKEKSEQLAKLMIEAVTAIQKGAN